MTPVPTLYTPREVAKALQMHERTVYDLLRSGRIRATKTGAEGSWRVTEDALRHYMGLDSDAPIPQLPVTPLTPLYVFVYSVWDSLSLRRVLDFSWRTEAGAGRLQLNEPVLLPRLIQTLEADGFVKPSGKTRAGGLPEMVSYDADEKTLIEGLTKLLAKAGVGVSHTILTVRSLAPEQLVERLEAWKAAHPPKRHRK
jgi:excisionase family DNA binding protein